MELIKEMKDFIINKTKQNIEVFGDRLPSATEGDKYKFLENGGWVGGFWNGILNYCYDMTGDRSFKTAERSSHHRYIKRLYEQQNTLDHDVGFLYILSFVADYKLTGNEESKKVALDVAKCLKSRFNEKGQFLQCWNVWQAGDPFSEENRGRIIIDSMYNIPLLFWAHKETGDEDFYRVAVAHAKTCAKYIVREDYTTFHTYVFDHETGKPKHGKTYQGFADESCWSRGQSWALGAYAHAYRYTGDKEFLELSKKSADVFIENLEDDYVAMWDFRLPTKENELRDTSATAIAAAGMLELASHLTGKESEHYRETAIKMITSLYMNYSTKDMPENQGMLIHACAFKPKNIDIDCSLIYGDYYFTEAVSRLLENPVIFW